MLASIWSPMVAPATTPSPVAAARPKPAPTLWPIKAPAIAPITAPAPLGPGWTICASLRQTWRGVDTGTVTGVTDTTSAYSAARAASGGKALPSIVAVAMKAGWYRMVEILCLGSNIKGWIKSIRLQLDANLQQG